MVHLEHSRHEAYFSCLLQSFFRTPWPKGNNKKPTPGRPRNAMNFEWTISAAEEETVNAAVAIARTRTKMRSVDWKLIGLHCTRLYNSNPIKMVPKLS